MRTLTLTTLLALALASPSVADEGIAGSDLLAMMVVLETVSESETGTKFAGCLIGFGYASGAYQAGAIGADPALAKASDADFELSLFLNALTRCHKDHPGARVR